MSLPRFPDTPDDCGLETSVCQILTSIAMEEIGLSHIINAEGEKLQYILGTLKESAPVIPATVEQVIEVNESVKEMLQQVGFSQMFLSQKMSDALKAYENYLKNGGKHGGGGNNHGGGGDNPGGGGDNPGGGGDNPGGGGDNPGGGGTPSTGDVREDIKRAGDGETIMIDGHGWIRLKGYFDQSNGHHYVLLLKKDLIGPWAYGSNHSVHLQYKGSDLEIHVNDWYDAYDSPKLKEIAVTMEPGESPSPSWHASGTGIYAGVPRKGDLINLNATTRAADHDYWLAQNYDTGSAGGDTAQVIVKYDGTYSYAYNETKEYVRPMVWVEID